MSDQRLLDSLDGTEIAIIGMAGRFPGAKNVDAFWHNLQNGIESITRFTNEELSAAGVDASILSDPNFVKANSLLNDVELFDAAFFGISDRDAAVMDPQHRFFLECAWEALETAGYDTERCKHSIGIYAGSGMNTYMIFHLAPNAKLMETLGLFLVRHLGNDKDFLTTRVSYHLNLKGPSINVQTACSTSLVAVHLACQSLLNGECDMALAGGVTIKTPQKMGYWYRAGEIQSPDGHCRPFDSRAQGTVFGSGVGVVVLKRLEDAIIDGDHIDAVIKGSAINNDGSLKIGYMAPGVQGYAEVVAEALAMARVPAETISYISAHGTGTLIGDVLEVTGLTQAFRASTQQTRFCAIGSVKGNIGHTDMAAGVASLMAATLALKHKLLPPSANFEQPNPEIDFETSPFYVNTTLKEWEVDSELRRAGVSSMGIGGTNAHIVLEEAPSLAASVSSKSQHLLVLSARTPSALNAATANLARHLKQHSTLNLADVAYTCQVGRRVFKHRRIAVCHDISDAISALENLVPDQVYTAVQEHRNRSVVFLFPGASPLDVQMAQDLYNVESVFRAAVDQCVDILEPYLGSELLQTLRFLARREEETPGKETGRHHYDEQVSDTPVLRFIVEYALAELWKSWSIRPVAVHGTGVGEYVAACVAGMVSLQDILALLAAHPDTVLSASSQHNGVNVNKAHQIEPDDERATDLINKLTLKAPGIPLLSSLTGAWLRADETADLANWINNLRRPIELATKTSEQLYKPEWILLEVVLPPSLKAINNNGLNSGKPVTSSGVTSLLYTLGQLWLSGVEVDWSQYHASERLRRIPLPTYPFEGKRYWVDPPDKKTYHLEKNTFVEGLPDLQQSYVAPRNEIEQKLADLWQAVLGLERVGIHDRFFDLGGTSQLAANVFAEINTQLGRNLPLVTLFEAPTIAQLADILSNEVWSAHWSSLVPLQLKGSKTPFFCVHAFRGNVLGYYPLARHLDRPCYGLQARGLNGETVDDVQLEEMAAHYIDEIRTVQPKGPYFLGGWCFGGEVAYEMAQQLQAQSEEVALVVMIQNPHRNYLKVQSEISLWHRLTHGLLDSVENEWAYLTVLEPQDRWPHLRQRAKRLQDVTRGRIERKMAPLLTKYHLNISHSTAYALDALAAAHVQAYWNYRPRPYHGRVAFFWASKQPRGISLDPGAGWEDLAKGEVFIERVPGHHHGSFLSEPYVGVLAEKLKVVLDQTEHDSQPTSVA